MKKFLGPMLIAALCAGAAAVHAADPAKPQSAPAKKPAAASKSKKAPAATKPASSADACKPASSNFVEPVCAPPGAQSSAQKFNTFEDIYSPPTGVSAPVPVDVEATPTAVTEPSAPPPPAKSE